jgi:hypothetical protein
MTERIAVPSVPNLPRPKDQFDKLYLNQLTNVLRLYFNLLGETEFNLAEAIYNLQTGGGGSTLSLPYVAASNNAIQYATAANTPTIVQWDTLTSGIGFTLNANNTATAAYSGVYKITYSLQFANNDNAAHDSIVWLRVNGNTSVADVADSTTIFTVSARKSAGVPTYVAAYSEVVFPLNAGDSVGLWWGATQAATSGGATGNYIYYQAAQTTPMAYPETPSAIGSITFVSALP